MPEARFDVVVKLTAPGLWDVWAYPYLNQKDEEHRLRTEGWIELWQIPGWGIPNKLIVDSTDMPPWGDFKFSGLKGSASDAVIWMNVYWLYVHYQKGHPGVTQGPEYRAIHDFSLGYNAWSNGVDTPTEVISSKISSVYSKLHPKAQEWAKKKGLILTIKA